MAEHVDADTFTRAETDRMFADLQRDAGGINRFLHNREPASVDHQTVIRMNRDTLYSFAVVDLSAGATLTLPDSGRRYLSAMVLDNDHYVVEVLHDAGEHRLDEGTVGTRYAVVAVRTLVDPVDPDDLAAAAAVQDGVRLVAESAEPFVSPDYDEASMSTTREALLVLASGLRSFDRMFGTREQVDPVHHLIGTAAGWGGLPTTEASYVGIDPQLPLGEYTLTLRDVPVDAFWSVSVYDEHGYFEPNPQGIYSINSVTAVPDVDGGVTVRFAPLGEVATKPNTIPVPERWNVLVRLYRPQPAVLDGTWTVPELRPA